VWWMQPLNRRGRSSAFAVYFAICRAALTSLGK
jgi:hypothetical protein